MPTDPIQNTGYLKCRRAHRLAMLLAPYLAPSWRVLDIGCGDGLLDHLLQVSRPGLRITGVDIARRPRSYIDVAVFDGARTPYADGAFDCVMLVDVLHHCRDPLALLGEARRVSRGCVLLKDHQAARPWDQPLLRFMDWFGNARDGVPLPYRYWSQAAWEAAFRTLDLTLTRLDQRLRLYPWPFHLLLDRHMHFIASLAVPSAVPQRSAAPGGA